jgi:hypothetical protein
MPGVKENDRDDRFFTRGSVLLDARRAGVQMGKGAAYLVRVGGIVGLLMWYVSPAALGSFFQRERRGSLRLTVSVVPPSSCRW